MEVNLFLLEVEHWIESDIEIDEDMMVESSHIPPPEMKLEHVQDTPEVNNTIKWIIMLLSVFQTQFYLTERALGWLLNLLFRFLGRYSSQLAELAVRFPQSLHQYRNLVPSILPNNSFERRAVCRSCESIYRFEECIRKVGTRSDVINCTNESFKKTCKQPLMREIRSNSGTTKFYPHKVYCFVSLISSLQTFVMRSGFIDQCESILNFWIVRYIRRNFMERFLDS